MHFSYEMSVFQKGFKSELRFNEKILVEKHFKFWEKSQLGLNWMHQQILKSQGHLNARLIVLGWASTYIHFDLNWNSGSAAFSRTHGNSSTHGIHHPVSDKNEGKNLNLLREKCNNK